MSSSELRIVLDRPTSTFAPGETVRGEVLARTGDEVRCRALTLDWEWRTHGKGNVTTGKGGKITLAQETSWSPGGEYRYPFQLTAPRGPLTYHGTLLNVDWYLRAVADVPWAFDPKVQTELLLAPGADRTDILDLGPSWKMPVPGGTKQLGIGGLVLLTGFCSIFIAVGAFIAFGGEGGLIAFPFGLVFMLAGLVVLALGLRNFAAQGRIGLPEVTIEPLMPRAGDEVVVRVRLRPRSGFSLAGIDATLAGNEVVVRGSGTNKTTHRHQLHQEQRILDPGGRTVEPRDELAKEATFLVPAAAAPSFTASDNAIEWKINVHVGVAGWPDWTQDFPIGVLPPANARAR